MDIAAFEDSPVGTLVPVSGHDHYLGRDYSHFAFVPADLPASLPLSERTYKLISEADRAVGRLDASMTRIPSPQLLTRPALRREAVSTSALEGTYTLLGDVLEADFLDVSKRTAEVKEVLNYVEATERGLELIKQKPICTTVIAELQAIIVRGTRGDNFDAGRLREGTVYIGEQRLGIEASRFVPPPAGQTLISGISAWEKWINADDDVPLLVKAAVGHYQYETLHPFSDGNGRLGRLVVTLQLASSQALRYPLLNLSSWLEPRKEQYKDLMLEVSKTGQWDEWVQFFCRAVSAQADDAVARIDELMQIRNDFLEILRGDKARGVVLQIVEDLIGYPVITISQAASLHGVTYPPAASAIERLQRLGILREATGRSYGRVYFCERVMRAVEHP